MKILYITCFVVMALIIGGLISKSKSGSNEWVYLFNGENLEGWEQLGGKAEFLVVDNMIVGSTVKGTPNSFLCTKQKFADFILELEVKVDSGLNSGIQIRSNSIPEYENGRVHGYQVEIDPTERGFNGRIWDEGRRKMWLDNLQDTASLKAAFIKEDWNKFKIEAKGDSIKTWINGVPIVEISDSMTENGFIGLQVHKINRELPLKVYWKNIRIKELK